MRGMGAITYVPRNEWKKEQVISQHHASSLLSYNQRVLCESAHDQLRVARFNHFQVLLS
jgi:hypothetical protein